MALEVVLCEQEHSQDSRYQWRCRYGLEKEAIFCSSPSSNCRDCARRAAGV